MGRPVEASGGVLASPVARKVVVAGGQLVSPLRPVGRNAEEVGGSLLLNS